MRLIDADKLDETIINLNDEGWDVTRSEYRLLDAILFKMPTAKAISLDKLEQIKANIFNACSDDYHMPVYKLGCDEIFEIIDKALKEQTDGNK